MKKFLIPFLAFYSLNLSAQLRGTGTIITLHPSVGAHILQEEKKLFSLFPEYPDSNFVSAQFVKYNDSTFTVLYQFKDTETKTEKDISREELWEIYKQVERIKPAPAPLEPEESKLTDKYKRFVKGLDVATEVLGYTVLWSVRLLNIFLGGDWK